MFLWNRFKQGRPFAHLVLDNVMPEDLLLTVADEFDTIPRNAWHQYNGPDEQGKRTCNAVDRWGPATAHLLTWLNSQVVAEFFASVTGFPGLTGDPTYYGGGLHVTEPGGHLGLHLDNEVHPTSRLLRRLNLVIYCTPDWELAWGGELEFWDNECKQCEVKVAPLFNRAVLFETTGRSYHGHTTPTLAPVDRRSIALYYWAPARNRALFVPRNGEQEDAALRQQRLARSM